MEEASMVSDFAYRKFAALPLYQGEGAGSSLVALAVDFRKVHCKASSA